LERCMFLKHDFYFYWSSCFIDVLLDALLIIDGLAI
jgi:hypothetical protein